MLLPKYCDKHSELTVTSKSIIYFKDSPKYPKKFKDFTKIKQDTTFVLTETTRFHLYSIILSLNFYLIKIGTLLRDN